MLPYYEKFFDVVEINYTFYSMPHPHTFNSFLDRTKRLLFSVKVNRIFTHERRYTVRDRDLFLNAVKPLLDSGRFIALLFQFPQSFRYSPESMEYINRLSEDFLDVDKVIEFRSRDFDRSDVFEEIESLGFSLVNVDAPKLKGVLLGPWKSIGTINYIRLHGRNTDKWHRGKEAYERYDYLYSIEELREIKRKIEKLNGELDTYVFFNNHYRGKGALNALQLKELFGESIKAPKGLASLSAPRLWE